ncbi:Probable peptidase [Mycobacteroides abscessus]|nr:Probable peptidase [Mycobacteroides abscessus]
MTSARRSLDPYLWLEDIGGDEPLNWVREHNATTTSEFSGARFEEMRNEALTILNTDAQIPYVRRRGEYLYNFWRDATNSRGLWREPLWIGTASTIRNGTSSSMSTPWRPRKMRTGCGPGQPCCAPTSGARW